MIRTLPAMAAAAAIFAAFPSEAAAGQAAAGDEVQIGPILEARARYEHAEQGALDADAVTLRLRAGAEARFGAFSLLGEAEATVAPVARFNAFPFVLAGETQRRPQHAVVADPENIELNRLQLQYRSEPATVTLGRQRINIDDQRWVGSVGWRQNEQTFDALRGEARLGAVQADLTYAIAQRTIFGSDAGPRTTFDGDFVFAGVSARHGPVQGRLFAYLLDYDEPFFLANSSQTYGGWVSAALPLGRGTIVNLRGSYARQADHGRNPFDYAADYGSFEADTALAGFNLAAGWEQLGSDNGRAVQTPMATLHKFNGWADLFLTTPPQGLEDLYLMAGRRFASVGPLRGLTANVAYHRFGSATGDLRYGHEWDASLGFQAGPFAVLLKFADYQATRFGADTTKFWLQLEWSL
jgi:hypothetical protein